MVRGQGLGQGYQQGQCSGFSVMIRVQNWGLLFRVHGQSQGVWLGCRIYGQSLWVGLGQCQGLLVQCYGQCRGQGRVYGLVLELGLLSFLGLRFQYYYLGLWDSVQCLWSYVMVKVNVYGVWFMFIARVMGRVMVQDQGVGFMVRFNVQDYGYGLWAGLRFQSVCL